VVRASVFTVSEGSSPSSRSAAKSSIRIIQPGLAFPHSGGAGGAVVRQAHHHQLYPAERFLTREQEQLNVDFYVKWRINNLRRYYEATGGTRGGGQRRLGETIKDSIKSVVTQRTCSRSSPRSAPNSPTP
jgi:regulator of protease activity HflC (stomatin/prohibitin superfamily)